MSSSYQQRSQRFAGRGRGDLQLSEVELQGGPGTRSAGAAGNVNVGSTYNSYAQRSPRYDQMAADWIKNRANEENVATEATANVMSQGIASAADVYAAKVTSEASIKASNKAADANKTGSMISGIGTVISAGIGLLSDESTKHTIEKIENACDTLRELNPVTFYYKEEYSCNPERLHHGFIAQEFRHVMPDATYYDESKGKLCIDTLELIALLVRANQELQYRVTRLEAKNALEAGVI